MLKNMNLPNRLSMLRILLVLLFVVVTLFPVSKTVDILATIIFVAAALTDALDGYIARSRNQITVFGKFIDPLADKMLTSAALIVLVGQGRIGAWIAVLIIAREFAVTGMRIIAVSEGVVIAASPLGKLKTISQMVAIAVLLLGTVLPRGWHVFGIIMILIALCLTLYSGYDYYKHCRPYLFPRSRGH